MGKMLLLTLLMAGILCIVQPWGSSAWQEKAGVAAAQVSDNSIKVSITTGGGMHGPVKSRFKVGEAIPVTISMTNTGSQVAKYCITSTLFQNRPQLKRDGQLLSYLSNLPKLSDEEEVLQRCERSDAKQFNQLEPQQTKVVDWITFGQMGINWYGPLPAGRYELVLRRRIECCRGLMVESNKAAFEVVP